MKVNAIPVVYRKVFGFVTGTAFTLPPESRSPSHRNAVHLPTGIAFGFDRIPQMQEPAKMPFAGSCFAFKMNSLVCTGCIHIPLDKVKGFWGHFWKA